MVQKPTSVDEYIASLEDWQSEIVSSIRRIILEIAPEATEAFKWSQPVYELGGPLCYIKAFTNHVNFGFWRGVNLEDPEGLLEGSGEKMRHVSLAGMDDIREKAFKDYVRSAVALNQEMGDPTKGS